MINTKTVLELFEGHPERWMKGGLAADIDDRAVAIGANSAVKWCLVGAIYKAYPEAMSRMAVMARVMGALPAGYMSILCFNDSRATAFGRVLEVVRKAGV